MSSAGVVLTNQILAEFGAVPGMRLFRNPVGSYWIGTFKGRTCEGHVLLANARIVECGMTEGAADVIGIRAPHGQILSFEVKAGKDRVRPTQRVWMEVVQSLGGLAVVVRSVGDVGKALG